MHISIKNVDYSLFVFFLNIQKKYIFYFIFNCLKFAILPLQQLEIQKIPSNFASAYLLLRVFIFIFLHQIKNLKLQFYVTAKELKIVELLCQLAVWKHFFQFFQNACKHSLKEIPHFSFKFRKILFILN